MASNILSNFRKAFSGAGSHDLSVADWQQSLFWAVTGVLALGACISSTNQRIAAEYGRLELQQQKVKLLQEALEVQQQAAKQQQQLEQFEAVLTGQHGSSSKWQPWHKMKEQLLSALAG